MVRNSNSVFFFLTLSPGEETSVWPRGGEPWETAETDHRASGAGPHQPAKRWGQEDQSRAGQGALQVPEHAEEPQKRGNRERERCMHFCFACICSSGHDLLIVGTEDEHLG